MLSLSLWNLMKKKMANAGKPDRESLQIIGIGHLGLVVCVLLNALLVCGGRKKVDVAVTVEKKRS